MQRRKQASKLEKNKTLILSFINGIFYILSKLNQTSPPKLQMPVLIEISTFISFARNTEKKMQFSERVK